ncbi:MAG: hypothetical protein ACOC56_02815 [Atribacterota bacterium]
MKTFQDKIVFYKGSRGKGKTLSMVKDGYEYHKNGWKVYRNFFCLFGEYITNEEILNLDKTTTLKNCVIMIDEIQTLLDSRRFMGNKNVNFSHFIQQLRKRNITLLATAQFSNNVDLRFRQHIDITAYPDHIEKYPVCEILYIDVTSIEDDILGEIQEPKIKRIVYNPKPIYKLYNTREMIK